jgi:hypothetical protein
MLLRSAGRGSIFAVAVTLLLSAGAGLERAGAQTPVFDAVHTIAAPTTGVPQEYTLNVSAAGSYTVTLTDLGATLTPSAPLASVKLAITGGNSLIGSPLVGAGAVTLSLPSAGAYVLHVVGMPGTGLGSGPFGIQVTQGTTPFASFQGRLALPSQSLPSGEAILDDSFTVSSSGNYNVALTDLQLPQSLTTLSLLLIPEGGAAPVVTLPQAGVYQATVALTAGVTYDVFAVGQSATGVNAGLFSAVIAPSGGGAPVFARVVPVGATVSVAQPSLEAGSDTFTLTDLAYPAALSQSGAVLTLSGQVVAQLNAPGSQAFNAAAANYEIFAVGTAASGGSGAGSYALQILPASGPAVFGAARPVTAPGSTVSAYGFDTTLTAAGSYAVTLTDFQFPAALSSLTLAAVQGGAILGTPLAGAGDLNVGAASGPLSLVVFAQSAGVGGLFGVDIAAKGGNSVFGVTQGVGALFTAQQISITAAGTYSVTAADLGFPANFATYDTIVTQGANHLGSIFGGGTFTFTATPGNYFVNFIAQPSGTDAAGTYALTVATAPPAPVVTINVDKPTVVSGGTVNIIWSSQNASACTASGGWTGSQATSGTHTSAPLTASTTFTLSCTGAGGTASKSVTVAVTAPSGGGGGEVDLGVLCLLATVLAFGCRARMMQRIRVT